LNQGLLESIQSVLINMIHENSRSELTQKNIFYRILRYDHVYSIFTSSYQIEKYD
jgi:hypothetical protein